MENGSEGIVPAASESASKIYNLCEEWRHVVDRLPDTVASEAIKSFVTVVQAISLQQSEELRCRKRSEASARELEKKTAALRALEKKFYGSSIQVLRKIPSRLKFSSMEAAGGGARPRGHWRPEEDETLRQLVEQQGPQNWNFIAEKLQGRSGKSCRFRWINHLDPVAEPAWGRSEEEEERLLNAHSVLGNKWALERFRLCGKSSSHNFVSSSTGNITMSNFLTKPSTDEDEEAADTINSGLGFNPSNGPY
ncbi:Transcription factor [Nymphaea thermarum]|nr:Transcription factor [Nymphaea thermarum]